MTATIAGVRQEAGRWPVRRTDPDATASTTAAGVCIAAVIIALGLARLHTVGGFGVETDFYSSYGIQATNIVSGRALFYAPHNAPGYTFLLAAATLFTGDAFVAGKILSALATGLIGWLTYLLIKQLYDARIALATVILLLIALIPFSYLAASDTIGALGVMLALWFFFHRSEHASRPHLFATGALAGAAYVIRSTFMFVVPGIGLSILLIGWRKKAFRRAIAGLGIFLLGAGAILLPWLEYNRLKYGSVLGSAAAVANGQVAAHFYSPGGDDSGRNNAQIGLQFRSLSDVVRYNPPLFARRFAYDVLSNVASLATALAFPGYLLVGAGGLLLVRRPSTPQLAFLVPLCLGLLVLGLVGFYLRYYLFMLPVVFLAVAYFLFNADVERMLGRVGNNRISLSWLIFFVLVASQSAHSYRETKKALATDPTYLIPIAQVLKERASPGDFVVARKPHLAYLAGLTSDSPQAQSAEEFLSYARSTHARYIVYSDMEASAWTGLKSLSDPEKLPHAFHLIYRHEPTNTLIYEVAE